MAARKPLSKKTRFEVFKRDSFKCQYCGKSAPDVILNVDHIKPVADGGTNHMTNLITSCFECNQGKKDRLLDDNSILEKQRQQLEELNERRQQLEMMMQWREGLMKLEDDKVKFLQDKWTDLLDGDYCLNDRGIQVLKRLTKKYGFNTVLDSIEAAINRYVIYDADGKPTKTSAEEAWKMVAKICAVKKSTDEKPYLKQLFYIRGILKNRVHYYIDWKALDLLEKAYLCGASIESLTDFTKQVRNWTQFTDELEEFIENRSKEDEGE